MKRYDLCLVWNWEYDAAFAAILAEGCAARGLALLLVTPDNLDATMGALHESEVAVTCLLDRASDSDPAFQPLVEWVRAQGGHQINPQERARWAGDKATMHLEFIASGLNTPHTLLLSPFSEQPELGLLDLEPLGGTFAIKPAGMGGGVGVVLEAHLLEQVREARKSHPEEKYLLQAHVTPRQLQARPAWFRVLFCGGAVYPCWWDTQTHVFARVTAEESARFHLQSLREIARHIAQICHLDLFSTEIALDEEGVFVVVDYVNDPIDLRLQSAAVDGVPDEIVRNIASRLLRMVETARLIML